jgi:hypothetical protein
MTPIDFDVNEAYVMPIDSGSPVFNVAIDFKSATSSGIPDYFNLKIRTYQTYKEWQPFTNYILGDRVQYYGNLYESSTGSTAIPNRVMNPRKYENADTWRSDKAYLFDQVVLYNNYTYQYSIIGTVSDTVSATASFTGVPYLTPNEWTNITEWKKVPLLPVQTFNEFRIGSDLSQYHFTIDTLIDPYLVIEVTSDNGYGQAYTAKKNYELRPPSTIINENINVTLKAPSVITTGSNAYSAYSSAYSSAFG